MTYYPYTILGGSDDYLLSEEAGIWENHGNNIAIESKPYSAIYTNTTFWEAGFKAVLNLNRLFMYVPQDREQRLTFLLKPAIYLHKYHSQARLRQDNASAAPAQNPMALSLGADIAIQWALSSKINIELASACTWVTDKDFEGIRSIKRSHDDFICTPSIALIWKFTGKQKTKPTPIPSYQAPKAVEQPGKTVIPFADGQFAFDYITVEKEIRKERAYSHTAYLHFPLAKAHIQPDFKKNRTELEKIEQVFNKLKQDGDITIQSIRIDGYASPESSHSFNTRLSQDRADAIANYIAENFNYPLSQIEAVGHAEDWEGLANQLEKWDSPEREEALKIVRSTMEDAEKKETLKKLYDYQALVRDVYPLLRRNVQTFSYIIKPFTIEQAKQLIHTRPDKLSAGEMVEVINSYPLFSQPFSQAVEIAYKQYPEQTAIRIYAAATAIRNNHIEKAENLLENIQQDERAWNLIAICHARENRIQQARSYFQKAIQAGDENARQNLQKLEQTIQ